MNRFILDFSSFYHLQTIIDSFVLDQYFLYNDLVQKPWKLQGTSSKVQIWTFIAIANI